MLSLGVATLIRSNICDEVSSEYAVSLDLGQMLTHKGINKDALVLQMFELALITDIQAVCIIILCSI